MTITDEQIKAVAGVRCVIPLHLKNGKTINIDFRYASPVYANCQGNTIIGVGRGSVCVVETMRQIAMLAAIPPKQSAT